MNRQPEKDMTIYVVEDNAAMRLGMVDGLQRQGYSVTGFDGGDTLLKHIGALKSAVPLMIVDLMMEPVGGLDVLKAVKSRFPQTQVLMISAHGTVENAVKAVQLGAADFLTKPFSTDELRLRVDRLFTQIRQEQDMIRLSEENRILRMELQERYGSFIGQTEIMRGIFNLIDRIAPEDTTVLIEGESGTGKELVARALHEKSHRSGKPFIKINCGALHDQLLESELFGHEKGAFTGAVRQRKGRFELANEGTLFLDEIGDISPVLQVKLLRVLQEREFERLGGEETQSVNVRIIAATNRNLTQLMNEKKFREDLYYRLRIIPVYMPTLRDRKEDIPLLVNHFLTIYAQRKGQKTKKISDDGMIVLQSYSWPGNIRELENLIERLCVISSSDQISTDLIAQHLSGPGVKTGVFFPGGNIDDTVQAYERQIIIDTLRKCKGVKNQAAKILGIKTSSLYSKMERLGIPELKEPL